MGVKQEVVTRFREEVQVVNGHRDPRTNTHNGFIRDAGKGEPTEEELAKRAADAGAGAKGEKRWRQQLNRLRKKMIDGTQLTTEEIESVLLWKALGWIRAAEAETHDKGLKLLETIYETRSRAKLAPGNNPAKAKKTGLGEKYGVTERPTTRETPETEERPRAYIPDPDV
jgi:hypothetical protein